jgi:8-oxo-dGTP pyrophosphatase MutT (NUDIX family)
MVELPVEFVERVRQIAAGTLQAPEPRDAATVVLLRDGASRLEVYLLRRVSSMAFAAGATVFPGGSVDPRDAHIPDAYWAGPAAREWTRALTADVDLARALVCAAVRETFEESGVVLAGLTADSVVEDARGEDWEVDRLALIDRSLSFAAFCERRGLVLRADLLRPWAHWITPEIESRRFDTRFFVAALPAGQRTRDVGGEADRVSWLTPRDALEREAAGEMALMPPTLATLTELTAYDTVHDVLAAADDRTINTVAPRVVVDDPIDGGEPQLRFVLPGDPDYER